VFMGDKYLGIEKLAEYAGYLFNASFDPSKREEIYGKIGEEVVEPDTGMYLFGAVGSPYRSGEKIYYPLLAGVHYVSPGENVDTGKTELFSISSRPSYRDLLEKYREAFEAFINIMRRLMRGRVYYSYRDAASAIKKYGTKTILLLGTIGRELSDEDYKRIFTDPSNLKELLERGALFDKKAIALTQGDKTVLFIDSDGETRLITFSGTDSGTITEGVPRQEAMKYIRALLNDASTVKIEDCVETEDGGKICTSSTGYEEGGLKTLIIVVTSTKDSPIYVIEGNDKTYRIKRIDPFRHGVEVETLCSACSQSETIRIFRRIAEELVRGEENKRKLLVALYGEVMTSPEYAPDKLIDDIAEESIRVAVA